MLLSDDQTQPLHAASTGGGQPLPTAGQLTAPAAPALPPEAVPHLLALRAALARYRTTAAPTELSGAFPAAGAVIGAMVTSVDGRPELEQLRRLADTVPEFGELLSAAAGEAERVVCAGTAGVWGALGLRSTAPAWTPAERDAARMVFACACAPAMAANVAIAAKNVRVMLSAPPLTAP